MNLNIVILAAGQGKRMYSNLPKVLHQIGHKYLLQHVIETAQYLKPNKLIVVYGHGGEEVRAKITQVLPEASIIWVRQKEQLGTGHALKCAISDLDTEGVTLVLYGDVPLIDNNSLKSMLEISENSVVMLTAMMDNPTNYGRIIRNNIGDAVAIVEEKDATNSQRLIKEINTGFYVLPNKYLSIWLDKLSNNNQQNEYYLTDIIKIAVANNVKIDSLLIKDHAEILGVNNKLQLEKLERLYQLNLANKLLENGVTLLDKSRIDIRGSIKAGKDCIIDVNCIFEGNVVLGDCVKIGAGCVLKSVTIEDNTIIKPYSIIEGEARIGKDCQIGPFSRIRPESKIMDNVHLGNFVEIKKSDIGVGSKINHLTYIGDAIVGCKVNVGAGSVTCNYDGVNKWQTIIKDNSFIGSGTMLVAPVVVNEGGVIGAGSTITKDTEPNELTVARSKQITVKGWLKTRNKKI